MLFIGFIFKISKSFIDIFTWFIFPSVAIWVGLIAAIGAALSIDTRNWFKSLAGFFFRTARVCIIWLFLAFLLRGLPGGIGHGPKGLPENEDMKQLEPPENPFTVTVNNKPAKVDISISFPHAPSNPSRGLPFACELAMASKPKELLKADNNDGLLDLLEAKIKNSGILNNKENANLVVYIKTERSPGESFVERFVDRLKTIHNKTIIIQGK